MNTENLQKVLAQIEAHPETWDQTKWHCGTKHCIAGWAQILAGKPEDDATVRRDARQYLGLTMTEASVLFDRTCSLDTLRTFAAAAWYDADGFGRDGFDRDGFDRDGFDWRGFDWSGFDWSGFDRYGFDWSGFDRDGFDQSGFNRDGFDRSGFDRDGLDINFNAKEK